MAKRAFVAAGALLLLALAALPFLLPDCSSDSAAVARARSLSQEELAALYERMVTHLEESDHQFTEGEDTLSSGYAVPRWISTLEPRNVRFNRPSVTLEGCMDHYVILSFHGIPGTSYESDPPGIELSWGEHEDSGVTRLWSP